MSAILLNDTDILRLSAQVNAQRALGLIPTGGLLASKGTYFQLMVTGESTVTYMIVMEASDKDFQAKANILSGLGAFALGTPQYLNGFWTQAFGDMAGSGGGGGGGLPDGDTVGQTIQWDGAAYQPGIIPADGTIYGEDDALGAPLPTINASAAAGYPLGIVAVDVSGQTNSGVYVVDGSTPLLQLVAAATTANIIGPSGTGSIALTSTESSVNANGGGKIAASNAGVVFTHPGVGGGNVFASNGANNLTGTMLIKPPFALGSQFYLTATSNVFTYQNTAFSADKAEMTMQAGAMSMSIVVGATTTSVSVLNNVFSPGSNGTVNCGGPSNRWNNVYAVNATIQTSDREAKQDIAPITDAVLDAVGDVDFVSFRFKAAVAEKEYEARTHTGIIAQQLEEAFTARGLDPFAYGVLCRDETDDGWVYGIRYDELYALEMARVRRELSRLSS